MIQCGCFFVEKYRWFWQFVYHRFKDSTRISQLTLELNSFFVQLHSYEQYSYLKQAVSQILILSL